MCRRANLLVSWTTDQSTWISETLLDLLWHGHPVANMTDGPGWSEGSPLTAGRDLSSTRVVDHNTCCGHGGRAGARCYVCQIGWSDPGAAQRQSDETEGRRAPRQALVEKTGKAQRGNARNRPRLSFNERIRPGENCRRHRPYWLPRSQGWRPLLARSATCSPEDESSVVNSSAIIRCDRERGQAWQTASTGLSDRRGGIGLTPGRKGRSLGPARMSQDQDRATARSDSAVDAPGPAGPRSSSGGQARCGQEHGQQAA